MEQTNKQQTNKQQTNKQQTNKQQTNKQQTNKTQTNKNKQTTLGAFGNPLLPTFPYGGLPLEFKNFSLTILPLTKQLNFYDKVHKCSLAVELTTSELVLFEWFANTLVEVAQANANPSGPQGSSNVAAE